jgi:hypothetical protein
MSLDNLDELHFQLNHNDDSQVMLVIDGVKREVESWTVTVRGPDYKIYDAFYWTDAERHDAAAQVMEHESMVGKKYLVAKPGKYAERFELFVVDKTGIDRMKEAVDG